MDLVFLWPSSRWSHLFYCDDHLLWACTVYNLQVVLTYIIQSLHQQHLCRPTVIIFYPKYRKILAASGDYYRAQHWKIARQTYLHFEKHSQYLDFAICICILKEPTLGPPLAWDHLSSHWFHWLPLFSLHLLHSALEHSTCAKAGIHFDHVVQL